MCLDAATGVRKWHFQIAHHGLWDYDPPAAPVLVTITRRRPADRRRRAAHEAGLRIRVRSRHRQAGLADRGAPGAAERRARRAGLADAAVSDAGPRAITPQGVTLDDAFDLTPELKAQAQEQMKKFRLGPLYTPPSMQGTLQRPGVIGGANWGGAAFDPETQTLFVKTANAPAVVRIQRVRPVAGKSSRVGSGCRLHRRRQAAARPSRRRVPVARGLPLVKPPYGELVAIDLNTGDFTWRVPFGDTPSVRTHPALAGVKLPDRLGASGVGGVIVTKGGLVLGAGGDSVLYAFDKTTGKELASFDLTRRASSTPMTYRTKSGRQFVVIATGQGNNASLMAFALDTATADRCGRPARAFSSAEARTWCRSAGPTAPPRRYNARQLS